MTNEELEKVAEDISNRILHVLTVFPFLSKSMLHMGIGTSTPSNLWLPLLSKMVEEGLIVIHEVSYGTPTDRRQNYTIYHLANNEYNYGVIGE